MSFVTSTTKGSADDLGASHVRAHKGQRRFLPDDMPPIIALKGDTNFTPDEIRARVISRAIDQGMKDPKEWKEWNDARKKKGRKNTQDNYFEYLENVSRRAYKNPEKDADEKRIIKANKGLAVEGGLVYVTNLEDYLELGIAEVVEDEEGRISIQPKVGKEDEIKRVKEFEIEAITEFYECEMFQAMHKDSLVQFEIQLDEDGTGHGQMVEVQGVLVKNPKGRGANAYRFEIAPTKFKEQKLSEYLGEDFERELRKEKIIQDRKAQDRQFFPTKEDYDAITDEQIDNVTFEDGTLKNGVKESKKTHCVKQLWYRLHEHKLDEIVKEKAKEKGLNLTPKKQVERRERLTKEQLMQKYSDSYKAKEKDKRIKEQVKSINSQITSQRQHQELDNILDNMDNVELLINSLEPTGLVYDNMTRKAGLRDFERFSDELKTGKSDEQDSQGTQPLNHIRKSLHFDIDKRLERDDSFWNDGLLEIYKEGMNKLYDMLPEKLKELTQGLVTNTVTYLKEQKERATVERVNEIANDTRQQNYEKARKQQAERTESQSGDTDPDPF